ncbi:DNA-directed RNA polymerase sigma-70 factor [Gemmatimonadetes bacterium T265]|nr:DNA-directed RNA polymerase sigma-70 factor [Gemmatimonadetes bacterium T265]
MRARRRARVAPPSPCVQPPRNQPSPEQRPPEHDAGGDLTALLRAAQAGAPSAEDAVYARVYDELRRLARRVRAGRAGVTLSTTALVHEAYDKLRPERAPAWEGRAHFFGVAARAMRDILVDAARRRGAEKRGGGAAFVTLGDDAAAQGVRGDELLALDEALDRLGALDARQLRVVEYRYFAGLTAAETADVLGVSLSTVEREWRGARAWLALELRAA